MQPELIKKTKCILYRTSIFSAYGMTEIAPISIKKYDNENECENLSEVGELIKEMKVKFIPQNDIQETGFTIGEVCINHSMIEKERYSDDGWFHTGDIGYLDERGELLLCGRLKNMLIRNGINIFPEVIEKKIRKSELIKEIVVFLDDSKLVSNIVVENPDEFELAHLIKYCKENLETEEMPCNFKIVEFIEKNESMKIIRNRQ